MYESRLNLMDIPRYSCFLILLYSEGCHCLSIDKRKRIKRCVCLHTFNSLDQRRAAANKEEWIALFQRFRVIHCRPVACRGISSRIMPMSPPRGWNGTSGQIPPSKEANEHCLNPKKCIGAETGQVNYVQKLKTKLSWGSFDTDATLH